VTQADGITGDAGADGSEPGVVQPLSRRDRLRAATTAEILQTARRLLVESGPEAVSLRAIAREMGMTAPGLYRYFGSHEELIRHVIAGIFIISGDRHRAEISRTDRAISYPLWDITSSSLNSPSKPDTQDEPNAYRVGRHNFVDSNFGLLNLDWSSPDPTLTMEIRNTSGKVQLTQSLKLSSLKPTK